MRHFCRLVLKGTVLLASVLAARSLCAAQEKTGFTFNVGFEYDFDNREFDSGEEAFTESLTLHAARLTPSVGYVFNQDRTLTHRVMAGIDGLKNMGESAAVPAGELEKSAFSVEATFWYGIEARLRRTTLKAYAGVFPRRYSVFGAVDTPLEAVPGRNIPTAFLSDANRFYDNNMSGILLTSSRRRAYYELSLDWLGMYGSGRREQFVVSSYGKAALNGWIHSGWAVSLHHYANAIEYGGVVDDCLLSPFVSFDLAELLGIGFQSFALTLNYFQGLHQDRNRDTGMEAPFGGQATVDLRNWNVGLRNETYYGASLMPYYNVAAPEGGIYGSNLYRGNPFYTVRSGETDWKKTGVYNRLEAYYQPRISGFLDLRISLVGHFAEGIFQGWQQKIGLVFDLERARTSVANARRPRNRERSTFEIFL